jgi:hypothetical protein
VKPHHSKILYDIYPGDKNLISIDGDHNSLRPRFFKDSAAIFFYNTLQVQYIKEICDNYAGFKFNIKKEEEVAIDDKNENVKEIKKENNNDLNNHNVASINSNSEIPKVVNPDHCDMHFLDDKMEMVNIEDDEEQIFKKILEISKKEFDAGNDLNSKTTEIKKEKEKDDHNSNIK